MSVDSVRDLVFISYSHANPIWRDRLLMLLKPFVRQGRLQVWADSYIQAGALWQRQIEAALARARVGVVLLTPDLLASDFVADVELPLLVRAATAGSVTLLIVPIEAHAAGATRFSGWDLADFQWPWNPNEPIGELSRDRRNRALVTITEAIVQAAGSFAEDRGGPRPSHRVGHATSVDSPVEGPLRGVPTFPPNYLRWDDAHKRLKEALLGSFAVVGVSASLASVGLHGQGGLGKTVVAQGITADEEIRRTFSDGIYWITVGQQPRLESLQSSVLSWCGERNPVEDLASGTRLLRERLRGKACLLVLDDVWQLAHAKAFDVLEGPSRLLVTTRDRSILTALGARDMPLEALPPHLALELLARWSGCPVARLPGEANEIADEVDCLPLALSLAGAQIRDGGSWTHVLAALKQGDLVYLDHPYGSVFKSLQASVDALEPSEAARYIELAVFPEDVEIPVSVIEQFWRETSGQNPLRLRALLGRLASRNLLRLGDAADTHRSGPGEMTRTAPATSVVTLHDLQYDFVRLIVQDPASLHRRLLDAWSRLLATSSSGDREVPDRWATLPTAPTYHWQFLAYHLRRAGRDQELAGLLTSPDWLFTRSKNFSVPALLGDYAEAQEDEGLRSVHDALVMSSHVLIRDSTALCEQLSGRLLNSRDPRVQSLIHRTPAVLRDRPVLRPQGACLASPGGLLLRTYEGHCGRIWSLAVLASGERALSANNDGTLTMWDLNAGITLQTFHGHTGGVRAVAVLPDGERALSGSDDETLRLWDLATGVELRKYHRGGGRVSAVRGLPDGWRFLAGSDDGLLTLWDIAAGSVLQTFSGHSGEVTAVALLPDGRRVLSGSDDTTLALWDMTTGALLQRFEKHTKGVTAVAVCPDGRRAISGSRDLTLRLWDLNSGEVLQTYTGHKRAVTAVTVLPDGHRALSSSDAGTLKLWDLKTGALLQNLEGHISGVWAVAATPDGERALSGSTDGTLKLWNLKEGDRTASQEGHSDWVTSLSLFPDGQRAFSASVDGTSKLWNLTDNTVLQTFRFPPGDAQIVALMPDGARALSAGWNGLSLIDLASGNQRRLFEKLTSEERYRFDNPTSVMPSPNGQRALSGYSDGRLVQWDLVVGTVLQTFAGHASAVAVVTVLEDGQRAISAGSDGSLKLWDLARATALRSFVGHSGKVTALRVLSDGQRVLSSSDDGTIKLWDFSTAKPLKILTGHSGRPTALTTLPDARRVISGCDDGTVSLWDLTTGRILATFYDDAPVHALSLSTRDSRFAVGNALGRVYMLGVE